jgi:hypothetical protein
VSGRLSGHCREPPLSGAAQRDGERMDISLRRSIVAPEVRMATSSGSPSCSTTGSGSGIRGGLDVSLPIARTPLSLTTS